MKSYYWWIVGVIALAILACRIEGVHAEPIQYYGTPVFYGKYTPNEVDCFYNPKVQYGFCGKDTTPEEAVIGFTKLDDPKHGEARLVRLFTEVVCVKGECSSNYGEPLGQLSQKGTSYWTIPTGYYLTNAGKSIMAFKHGTGPLVSAYPMKNVLELPELKDPPAGIVKRNWDHFYRYDVYCNGYHECSYMGVTMLANQLDQWIPFVMTVLCDELFCYNPDRSVAGLNPKTYGRLKQTTNSIMPPKGLTQAELLATHP